jgi:hypothetical protein
VSYSPALDTGRGDAQRPARFRQHGGKAAHAGELRSSQQRSDAACLNGRGEGRQTQINAEAEVKVG